MSQEISMQPRLYAGSEDEARLSEESQARIARIKAFDRSVGRRPETFLKAFVELGEEATAGSLELHDDEIDTRGVSKDPKEQIKEILTKRDDLAFEFDEETEEAIYSDPELTDLIKTSRSKVSVLKRKGVMGSVLESNPEAQSARDAVRRKTLGLYLGRVVLWKEQQQEYRKHRAS